MYFSQIPRGFAETSISKFLCNYELIKKLGLPTLNTVERCVLGGCEGVMCDNVNYSNGKIYVTYNSLYSDSQKLLYMLSKDILGNREERKTSLAEEFRYRNKIEEIINFEEFVISAKSDLILATKQDILIEFDSYFFGSQKYSSITEIDYKIVDLDHIFTDTNKTEEELLDLNFSEFMRALGGFLKYFVSGNNQIKYLEYLDRSRTTFE